MGTLRSPSFPAVFAGMTSPAASVAPGLVVGLTAGGVVSGTTGTVAGSLVADGAGRAWFVRLGLPAAGEQEDGRHRDNDPTHPSSTIMQPWFGRTRAVGTITA